MISGVPNSLIALFSWPWKGQTKNGIMKVGDRGAEFSRIHWVEVHLAPFSNGTRREHALQVAWAFILNSLAIPFRGMLAEADGAEFC